jgi:hypothetical protein
VGKIVDDLCLMWKDFKRVVSKNETVEVVVGGREKRKR